MSQKHKKQSQISVLPKEEKHTNDVALDGLHIRVQDLKVPEENSNNFVINAAFYGQRLICDTIISVAGFFPTDNVKGEMYYDPSDYAKMGEFADTPLVVTLQSTKPQNFEKRTVTDNLDVAGYVCNIDIVTVFTDTDCLIIEKRMEPTVPSILRAKSWKNLPLITIEIKVQRNEENSNHHETLRDAILMKFTLVGCYNMKMPFDEASTYTCATKLPICNQQDCQVVMFNKGEKVPKRFNHTNFLPKWECLRSDEASVTKDDEKFFCGLEDIDNKENLSLDYYINELSNICHISEAIVSLSIDTTIWASFHRTLIVKSLENWLYNFLIQYKWPLEIQVLREGGGYNFMAFLDLIKLVYPGENIIRLVVPLHWANPELIMENCGCENLLTPNEKEIGVMNKLSKATTNSAAMTPATTTAFMGTGSDDNSAFVLVEVKLGRPLKESCIPPAIISNNELTEILRNAELSKRRRFCWGRSHQDGHWVETVRNAANLLRTVPHYGLTDHYNFFRKLHLTKTRVELETSFWQEAAHYVNNNFVPSQFLHSDVTFEELIMMAHVSLMHIAEEALLGSAAARESKHAFLAARQARQLQDIPHAIDLYLQTLVEQQRDPDIWRELSTCYKDEDMGLANVCINKAIELNPRHPLSLLSKACLVMEDNAEDAEPFFMALLDLYPFCIPVWVAASAYYFHRELFSTSEEIMEYVNRLKEERISEPTMFLRSWNDELGEWWDHTPILIDSNVYYDAADLLLRIRGVTLAEVCLALSVPEDGETPTYYHLLALCCRLRGDFDNALCHLEVANNKYPGISYLKSLEAECHFKQGNFLVAKFVFDESVHFSGPYNTLLSVSPLLPQYDKRRARSTLMDLLRRQPSSYAWITFAEFWLKESFKKSGVGAAGDASKSEEQSLSTRYAIVCAEQALKYDGSCGYACATLSKIVKPSAKRMYYQNMAILCGYKFNRQPYERRSGSKQPLCYHIGKTIDECECTVRQCPCECNLCED